MKDKRFYERMEICTLSIIPERQILAASVVDNAMIQSTGQELGPEYDISAGTDEFTGKVFSNEWDMGGGL